jgi:dinuclear metal center YbgI/SA1388 family protein
MLIKGVIDYLDNLVPHYYSENNDNVGLILGDSSLNISGILICLDITEDVLKEAVATGCNLIVAHHPIIFTPIKKINNDQYVQRCVKYAIKNDLCVYCMHTNLDSWGLNRYLANLLSISDLQVLRPLHTIMNKLTVFMPVEHVDNFFKKTSELGIYINNEQQEFKADNLYLNSHQVIISKPAYLNDSQVSKINARKMEIRKLELILPCHLSFKIIKFLEEAVTYKEYIVYYTTELKNFSESIGLGILGELKVPIKFRDFIFMVKNILNIKFLRHSEPLNKVIKKVALCTGSGRDLINNAVNLGADLFMTSDLKYHDFFIVRDLINLVDIGHYESEVIVKDLIFELLYAKFSDIFISKCKTVTNPIIYS